MNMKFTKSKQMALLIGTALSVWAIVPAAFAQEIGIAEANPEISFVETVDDDYEETQGAADAVFEEADAAENVVYEEEDLELVEEEIEDLTEETGAAAEKLADEGTALYELDELSENELFADFESPIFGDSAPEIEVGKVYSINAASDNSMFIVRNPVITKLSEDKCLFRFGLTVDYNALCLKTSYEDGSFKAYFAQNVEKLGKVAGDKPIKWEYTIPVEMNTTSLDMYYIKSDNSWGDVRRINFDWSGLQETEEAAPDESEIIFKDAPADYKTLNGYVTGKKKIVPDDLYDYTNESAEAVWEAKAAINWNLLRKDGQDQVDESANALKTAVDNLVPRKVPEYPDGEYELQYMESSLGMFHFSLPAKLVIHGDEVTLTVSTSDKKTTDRYEYICLGVYNDIPDLAGTENGYKGTVDGDVRTFVVPLKKNMLDSNIYYVLRYAETYSSNAGQWYKPRNSNKYYFTLGNIKDADYTKVDEAIKKVPDNTDIFTEESVKALEEAVQAVDRSLDFLHQEDVDGMADNIENAIATLTLKDADYTKVDQAISKIPADLSGFTDETAAAVDKAKNAVVRGKKVDEQNVVDAMAEAIEKAVAGLKAKAQQPALPAAGTTLTSGNAKYVVETPGSTVAYQGPVSKQVKAAEVPETVTIDGVSYTVDSIAANAFKNCKKMTKVTVGANIVSIGAKAFAGTKNLRNVVIRSNNITKIGKKAFSKAGSKNYAKLRVRVPKMKLKAYKKLFKKAGLSAKAKVRK